MKKINYRGYTLSLLLLLGACSQEDIALKAPETTTDTSCEDATAGSADFTKFVALGSSYTAGFQAGALFTAGQENSLGNILATQFECVGGGAFNQPSINSQYGFNILISPNPGSDNKIAGRLLLQGTPPTPKPYKYDVGNLTAAPNPMVNPGFIYTGSPGAVAVNQLNNFSVPAIQLGQALITQTGNWAAPSDPRFNPFYARFASNPGASTLLNDAISSLSNEGTFFLFWLGMDDVLLHALYGGDGTKAPLTSLEFVSVSAPGFKNMYNSAIGGILANPSLKGVIANYPDIFTMPHFTSVAYNPVPLDQATVTVVNQSYAGYNQILDALKGAPFNFPASEMDARKISFQVGNNPFVIIDETLNDLGDEFDALAAADVISDEQRAALVPYEQVRQTKSTDIIPLSTGSVLGTLADPENPLSVRGVAVPLGDQYALIPSEVTEINSRLADFNAHIKSVADANTDRIAFADVNKAFKDFVTAKVYVMDGVTITPAITPPTGIYSEEGLHPNSRGYAFISNVFIEAINAKFGATIPKAKLGNYAATGLPINP